MTTQEFTAHGDYLRFSISTHKKGIFIHFLKWDFIEDCIAWFDTFDWIFVQKVHQNFQFSFFHLREIHAVVAEIGLIESFTHLEKRYVSHSLWQREMGHLTGFFNVAIDGSTTILIRKINSKVFSFRSEVFLEITIFWFVLNTFF